MKILLVNQFYWPDVAATAQQLADLAEDLASNGHEVHVLCSGGDYTQHREKPTPRKQIHRGVHIRRIATFGSRKRGNFFRFLEYLSFHLSCGLRMLMTGRRYTHIVTLTDPPFLGAYAMLVKWFTRGRTAHVIWSMDLNMETFYELGLFRRRNPVAMILEWIDRLQSKRANAIVVLGDCMRRRLLPKGVPNEKITTIPVWNRSDQLEPIPAEENPLRKELGLEDTFVVMYSGNAGRTHTFDAICHAMRQLDGDDSIRFAFIGAGKRMAEIEQFVEDHSLTNVLRLPYYPRERLNHSLALGDVHLISLRRNMAGVVVPCKLYGIMAVRRPVLFVGPGDSATAEQIEAAEAGKVIDPDDSAALVAAIRTLKSETIEGDRLGDNARQAFVAHYERAICCQRWRMLLESVTARSEEKSKANRQESAKVAENKV